MSFQNNNLSTVSLTERATCSRKNPFVCLREYWLLLQTLFGRNNERNKLLSLSIKLDEIVS